VKKHVKLVMQHYGYGIDDFIPCFVCNRKAVDIHHIEARGIGGSKYKDTIDNLIPLCRSCHHKYGDKKQYKEFLKQKLKEHGNY